MREAEQKADEVRKLKRKLDEVADIPEQFAGVTDPEEYKERMDRQLKAQKEMIENVRVSLLEAERKLENTVIIGITDHYTYGYKDMESLYTLSGIQEKLLLEKTPCFIWSKDLQPMEVDKVLNTSDFLPTVLNLLGVETEYGYHVMFYSQVFDNTFSYSELEAYLDDFCDKYGKSTWEEVIAYMIADWDNWEDKDHFLYNLFDSVSSTKIDAELTKIQNKIANDYVYNDAGYVVKYANRYADLLKA